MEFPTLQIEIENHVATVSMATEKKGNPLGPDLWNNLGDAFTELSANPDVRAIVLQSSTDQFSYGLDLMSVAQLIMPALNEGFTGREKIRVFAEEFQDAFSAIAKARQPVVAAITGWCIGGGVELAAACDLRVCDSTAKFSLREVKVGIVPDVGGIQRLPHIIGEAHVREMAYTGDDYDAAWAERVGFVNRVAQDAKAEAREIASKIAGHAPAVVAGIKDVFVARTDAEITSQLNRAMRHNTSVMQSEDFMEAISAFMEKRDANFTGK